MKKSIMVLDDDPGVCQALGKLLEQEGYRVVLAASADEAYAQFDPATIDLLLLDLTLPGKSGWDVFERVTSIDPLLPIIIITGREKQRELALGAGVGALMQKPLDIPRLLASIKDLLAESAESRLKRLTGMELSMRYYPPAKEVSRRRKRFDVRPPRPQPNGTRAGEP